MSSKGDRYVARRHAMVERQLAARDIRDAGVLEAMGEVPREHFVTGSMRGAAYQDRALPIDAGQTISQPYVVALMIQALRPEATDRVLEIGTGSGYGAAVLSRIVARVYTVERHASLLETAQERWDALGYGNIEGRVGDGTLGWPAEAPFDGIVVTAGAPAVPEALEAQLAPGAVLVVPVGGDTWGQRLLRIRKGPAGLEQEDLGAVAFVPLVGRQGW